ncbi:MAG: electron transport complex subunit E [Clostridiales bacterium]|nr:electron transport complex subunit E [Clostridiales bacterium]
MPKRDNLRSVFLNGVLTENPIFRLVLGTCPAIAVTTSTMNGIGMGLAATFVLLGSNVVISMLRNFIPSKVRIPAFIVVICTFVTIIQLLMQAYVPSLYDALGIFLPLIVVNCIILARAEAFASKNGVFASAVDALGMGLGFTLALIVIGGAREILGAGTFLGFNLLGAGFEPVLLMILPPGGFIVYGLSLGIINAIANRRSKRAITGKEGVQA